MKITLMHPALDDPTLPYHSSAYLKGHLVHNGFTDVSMRDINVEFVDYCLAEANIDAFYDEGQRRLRQFEGKFAIGFQDQEEFYALWASNRIEAQALVKAAKGLKDKEAFLDYSLYLKNVNLILRYFGFLGALSHPSEYGNFKQKSRARYSNYNLTDLFNVELTEKLCYPFLKFFDERLSDDPELKETDCFGISIVYDHQLFHALALARALKQKWPDKLLLLGGTSIGQLYKHLRDKSQIKRFFKISDAIVVGEGETAICEIADTGGDLRKKKNIPNTITYEAEKDLVRFPMQIHYENVATLGAPVYDHPWHLYLAPEKGINYAPTRGCYWNRCTFCDYGLNSDKPTSPWRERRIDQVIEDLRETCTTEEVKNVYFAVDVMAPGYLERLSDAIVDSDLDIRWAAELRMEKIFSAERCKKMARGGCVCISFGMESGNQRILNLIDKGTNVDYMAETMKNFASAGVAVQLMAFTDFPTETVDEKNETYAFIERNKGYWSTGGMGTFLLTGTAMIAKDPEKFGITLVETKDADITRALAYRVDQEAERKVLLTEDSDASFDDSGGAFPPVLGRPWAGGTDTLHSMIYYDAYGRLFFKEHPVDEQDLDQEQLSPAECAVYIPGKLEESAFDVSQVLRNRQLYTDHITELLQTPIEPTYANYHIWQAQVPPVPSGGDVKSYWVVTADRCAKLDKLVFRVLSLSADKRLTLNEVMASLKPELKEKLLNYFEELEEQGLLIFHDPRKSEPQRRKGFLIDDRTVVRSRKTIPGGKLVLSLPT
jgi:radical SAM family protein